MDNGYEFENEEERAEIRDAVIKAYGDGYGSIDRAKLNSSMDSAERFFRRLHLLCSAVFILAGLAFLIAGSLMSLSIVKDKKECTVPAMGEVASFNRYESLSDDGPSNSYAPVFRYTYNGEEYTYAGHSYSDTGNLYVGKQVDIYVDPADPNHIYVPEYKTEKKNAVIFIIVGIGLIAGMIAYSLYKSRQMRKDIQNTIESSI